MEQFDPLQRKRESVQAQQSVLFEKLSELRYRSGYTSGASEKFQLEKDIEQTEAELEKLEQQLSALDRTSAVIAQLGVVDSVGKPDRLKR